jgi:hypothetical protein
LLLPFRLDVLGIVFVSHYGLRLLLCSG